MPCSGCSALHGVNPNFKKMHFKGRHDLQEICIKLEMKYIINRTVHNSRKDKVLGQDISVAFILHGRRFFKSHVCHIQAVNFVSRNIKPQDYNFNLQEHEENENEKSHHKWDNNNANEPSCPALNQCQGVNFIIREERPSGIRHCEWIGRFWAQTLLGVQPDLGTKPCDNVLSKLWMK